MGWRRRPGDPAGVHRWWDGYRWTSRVVGGDVHRELLAAEQRVLASGGSDPRLLATLNHWRRRWNAIGDLVDADARLDPGPIGAGNGRLGTGRPEESVALRSGSSTRRPWNRGMAGASGLILGGWLASRWMQTPWPLTTSVALLILCTGQSGHGDRLWLALLVAGVSAVFAMMGEISLI